MFLFNAGLHVGTTNCSERSREFLSVRLALRDDSRQAKGSNYDCKENCGRISRPKFPLVVEVEVVESSVGDIDWRRCCD